MRPTIPRKPTSPGWSETVYAEHQPQYLPLPSLRNDLTLLVPVISVWQLEPGDVALMKAMIASHEAGGPAPRISLELSTFGQPLQPIRLTLGEFAAPYEIDAPPGAPRMLERRPRTSVLPNPPQSTSDPVGS